MKDAPFHRSISLLEKWVFQRFVRILEILENPGILFWHFPGLESPGKLMQVLESPQNL